jgi:hypothetical protein
MEEEKNNMDARIILYNQHYGFLENPTIIKNYALRNKDRKIYENYLNDFFPNEAVQELANFDAEIPHVVALSNKDLSVWLLENHVKLLQSDINETDKDAIFKVMPIAEGENPDAYLEEEGGFILKNISPLKIIDFPYSVWLNKSSGYAQDWRP